MEDPVFSQHTINFVKTALEFCSLAEKVGEYTKNDFIDRATKVFPLLYLNMTLIPEIEEDYDSELENKVTEEMYEFVKERVSVILEADDVYLETFHPDIQLSDSPVAVKISEDVADIYQDLGNFVAVFKNGNKETMNDSLVACVRNFREYWGQRLLNALRALHALKYEF